MIGTVSNTIGDFLIRAGLISAGSVACGLALGLIVGAIANELGHDLDPWRFATEKGAPLGAVFGVFFALAELIPVG